MKEKEQKKLTAEKSFLVEKHKSEFEQLLMIGAVTAQQASIRYFLLQYRVIQEIVTIWDGHNFVNSGSIKKKIFFIRFAKTSQFYWYITFKNLFKTK